MTRAAVVWSESNELRCRQLSESAENIVSRSPDATVFLTDRAVSRSPHADFRYVNGAFVVEHLRTGVMPTLVNDAPIDGATQLSDQDVVQIGSTRLVFHDLSTHDKRSARVQCSYCNAENDEHRSECWRCGENMANARSAVYQTSRVECRVVAPSATPSDLFRDDTFELSGSSSESGSGSAAVAAGEGRSYLRLSPGASSWPVNGQPASDGRQLATGDTLAHAGDVVLVIVR